MSDHRQVDIRRGVRRLRGESQAHLIHGNDDRFYVAKFAGNPKSEYSLAAEWIAHRLLQQLGVSVPTLCLLHLPQEIQRMENFRFIHEGREHPVRGDLHLGSALPCDPRVRSIWDFLPHRFLNKVENLADFATVLVFDVWLQKVAPRQAIFVRMHQGSTFRAFMIDHCSTSLPAEHKIDRGGSNARVRFPGTYLNENVYGLLKMRELCEQAVDNIQKLSDLHRCAENIPSSWVPDEKNVAAGAALHYLDQRRNILSDEVAGVLKLLPTRD